MVNKVFYTYPQMEDDIDDLQQKIVDSGWRPDIIVGILRGGVIPAVHFSHIFEAPMVSVHWSNYDDEAKEQISEDLKGYLFANSNILIVDDICDSGETLAQLYEHMLKVYNDEKMTFVESLASVKSAVLHHNEGEDVFEPDFYVHKINKRKNPCWLVYPWEQDE